MIRITESCKQTLNYIKACLPDFNPVSEVCRAARARCSNEGRKKSEMKVKSCLHFTDSS